MGICGKRCETSAMLRLSLTLTTLGILLVLFGGIAYNRLLIHELVLTNTSRSYAMWKETPVPMYLSIKLFNWTNAEEVVQSKWSVKPEFQERGPYVFSEHHIRVNLTWNQNGTVTYQQKRIWHFMPSQSNGSLNDKITNFNPVVAVVGNIVKYSNIIVKALISGALRDYEEGVILTKTVDELLFTGYDDQILTLTHKVLNIPFTKFGWFYSRNHSSTYDGTFTIYTGKTGLDLVGIMDLWNGQPHTNDYNGYCALVNGTSGELWPPVKDYSQISIFSSDICSPIAIDYQKDQTVNGIIGKRFVGTDFTFDNGTEYPEQACFQGDKVVPSGTRDVSRCKFDAPAFISYPHFYLADPSYRLAVKGMHPNQTEHEMHMTLEANTGIPLEARAQLQLNLFVEPISGIEFFSNIKPTYIPMYWFRQTATLTEEYCSMVGELVKLLRVFSVVFNVGWSVVGVGILFAIVGVLILLRTTGPELFVYPKPTHNKHPTISNKRSPSLAVTREKKMEESEKNNYYNHNN